MRQTSPLQQSFVADNSPVDAQQSVAARPFPSMHFCNILTRFYQEVKSVLGPDQVNQFACFLAHLVIDAKCQKRFSHRRRQLSRAFAS